MTKIEMRCLRDVARFHNDSRITVRGTQRLLQKGPYRFYAEPGALPYDDYVLDGQYVLLGSVLNVVSPAGTFQVTRANGKIAVSELYHVISGMTDDDTEYLAWVLSHTPVAGYVDLGGQVVRLEERRMGGISVPWPDARTRKAVSLFMRDCRDRARDAKEKAASLREEGAKAFLGLKEEGGRVPLGSLFEVAEGRFLESSSRRSGGKYPVVSSQGVVGHSDEVGCEGQCIVVGQAGQYALQYWMPDGAFALQDTVCISKSEEWNASDMPLEAVYFALYAEGIRNRLRVAGKNVKAKETDVSRIGECLVPDFSNPSMASGYCALSRKLMRRIVELEREAEEAALGARRLMGDLIKGDVDLGKIACFEKHSSKQVDLPDSDTVVADAFEKEPSVEENAHRVADNLFELVASDFGVRGIGYSAFDVAWEAIPLLYIRLKEGRSAYASMMNAVSGADRRRAIDDLLVRRASEWSELSFLENLTTSFSSLSEGGVERLLDALLDLPACMDCAPIGAHVLRMLNCKGVVRQIGDSDAYKQNGATCPLAVSELLSGIASVFAPEAKEIFDPCMIDGSMAMAATSVSGGSLCAQTSEAGSMLVERLCASLVCPADSSEIVVGESALLKDAFSGRSFDFVTSFLPCNETDWTDAPLDANDQRWIFGMPPRNKANLAWFQHAYAHRSKEGTLVLLAANALLHESRGCEPDVRKSIIDSGCIRAVISLPGRLFDDGRAAQSIIVAQDCRGDDCETLFIDATACGVENAGLGGGGAESRLLLSSAIDKILSAIRFWELGQGYVDEKGFCRSVEKSEIMDKGVLTPWTFVQ